ncbi:ribbon-helix-helix protein, CopG family [Bradyrhizobium australafricanum]|nr:ribbon-helix-helix protein, CopG family [Bradyrhizobium australafricanum]
MRAQGHRTRSELIREALRVYFNRAVNREYNSP